MKLNKQQKIDCVQACINTYKGKHGKTDWSIFKDDTLVFFDFDNCEGYCAIHKDGTLMIVFTGSNEDKDWETNFNFNKEVMVMKDATKIHPYGNNETKILVHRGFYNLYKKIRKFIHATVERYITDSGKNIIVTGHSLGGALATLCGVDIEYNFDIELAVVTAGSPRVGNAAFKKSYNKRVPDTYRLWLGEDPVTKVPPDFFGFRHVGIPEPYGIQWAFWFKILPIAFWDHRPEVLLEEMKK